MSSAKLNFQKIIVACVNVGVTIFLFFALKRFLLRLFGVKVGKKTTVHRGVKFFCFGNLVIGDDTTINYQCFLDARGGLTIGDNVNISHSVRIYTMGHDINHPRCITVSKPVVISNNAWIFPNVLVMPGVVVGEGAVIYPGSVVTKSLDAYTIYAGNPAKAIGLRNRDISYSSSFPVWFGI